MPAQIFTSFFTQKKIIDQRQVKIDERKVEILKKN